MSSRLAMRTSTPGCEVQILYQDNDLPFKLIETGEGEGLGAPIAALVLPIILSSISFAGSLAIND